jgi:hypothetical protein
LKKNATYPSNATVQRNETAVLWVYFIFIIKILMNHQKLFRWAKNHFFGLLVSFVVFCTLLGLRAGLGLAMEDDAP